MQLTRSMRDLFANYNDSPVPGRAWPNRMKRTRKPSPTKIAARSSRPRWRRAIWNWSESSPRGARGTACSLPMRLDRRYVTAGSDCGRGTRPAVVVSGAERHRPEITLTSLPRPVGSGVAGIDSRAVVDWCRHGYGTPLAFSNALTDRFKVPAADVVRLCNVEDGSPQGGNALSVRGLWLRLAENAHCVPSCGADALEKVADHASRMPPLSAMHVVDDHLRA